MTYLDTSVLVPLYVNESGSMEARKLVATLPSSELAISEWSQTEFASAVGIRVRTRHLNKEAGVEIVRAFHHLATRAMTLLPVEAEDFALASEYLSRFELGLRAGDALHLAIASNHGASVYSSDQVMLKCARRLGIKAHGPLH